MFIQFKFNDKLNKNPSNDILFISHVERERTGRSKHNPEIKKKNVMNTTNIKLSIRIRGDGDSIK